MWTGRNRQEFLAYFLDKNFKIHEITLIIKYIRYPHTAKNISETLLSILDEWNIKKKVYMIVTDNGSNIKKTINDMSLKFSNIK